MKRSLKTVFLSAAIVLAASFGNASAQKPMNLAPLVKEQSGAAIKDSVSEVILVHSRHKKHKKYSSKHYRKKHHAQRKHHHPRYVYKHHYPRNTCRYVDYYGRCIVSHRHHGHSGAIIFRHGGIVIRLY